jgi:hypothetical protein
MPTVDDAARLKVALEGTVTNLVVEFERQTGLQVTGLYVPMFRHAGESKDAITVTAKLP